MGKLTEKYGEFISKDNMCRELHISKRKATYILENQIIECKDSGKKTRRFTIRTKDVEKYLSLKHKPPLPMGMFSSDPYHRKPILPLSATIDKKYFSVYLKKYLDEYPDALTSSDIAKIIGYSVTFVNKNIKESKLKSVDVSNKTLVAKQWLIDFMSTDYFMDIQRKPKKIKELFERFDL